MAKQKQFSTAKDAENHSIDRTQEAEQNTVDHAQPSKNKNQLIAQHETNTKKGRHYYARKLNTSTAESK
jgi:hypothetical protein